MMNSRRTRQPRAPLGLVVLGLVACADPELSEQTFYGQRIAPILQENCVRGTADGLCHIESDQMPGQALGNLDLNTFESIHRRPELLAAYGSYPEPVLLLKAVKPNELTLLYAGESFPSEIFHAGGGVLSLSSEAFIELQQWLRDGATQDGVPVDQTPPDGQGPCSTALRPDVEPFLATATGPAYDAFVADVQPILTSKCSYGSCHGSSQSDLYLTCGDTPEQLQHNFIVTQSFVADPSDRSELLLRPLAVGAGGVNHSGGDIWSSTKDSEFATLREWSALAGPLVLNGETPEFDYYASHVLPVLLKRGCAMPQCHSPQGFNDFRLRAGSRGFFSPLALRRNYDTTLHEFVNLDAADPNQSRILKKNISTARGGIQPRAGVTLLDQLGGDMGGTPSVCPAGEDEQPTSYCTVVEWIRRERAAAVAEQKVTALAEGDPVPVIYVDRPADADRVIDFATFRPGARLMRVDLTMAADGRLSDPGAPLTGVEIDLTGCGTFTAIDVRRPEISYDGTRMVFALRDSEADGLDLFESDLDGANCRQVTTDGQGSANGVPIHNFDPVYIPDDPLRAPGGAIVYASTRAGRSGSANVSPRYRLPASNLWRVTPDGADLGQMTFLNGSELSPAVMHNGQVTMTTEKATSDFYQLSGRRINWDLTDYHPLLAQRESVGFGQATFIREAPDRDFVLILSDPAALFSGGALATFNRSLGPFEAARVDEPGYAPAVTLLDPAAANAGKGVANGAYRSPYPAFDGRVLVSYAAGSIDLSNAGAAVDYDLVLFDPVTGARTLIAGGPGFQVDGVVAHARSLRRVFVNLPQLVFGGTNVGAAAGPNEAWAHFPDLPMLATLLSDNHRGGRGLDALADGDTLAIYRAAPPPGGAGDGGTFESWELIGTHALADDGSAFVRVPAGEPVVLELRRGDTPLLTMTEEHQFGPGEQTSLGISRTFFDGVCGGCHGSIDGPELDVVVDPDALTGASVSLSRPQPGAGPSDL